MRKPTSEITGNDIINGFSKGLTGSAVFAIGLALAKAGFLVGEEYDKKQAGFDALQGEQENAFVLPDGRSFTIDTASSVAVPLLMAANLVGLIEDEGLSWETLDTALTSIADPIIQNSMLQGMDDTLNNIKYSDNNLIQIFLQSAVAYLTQGLTNTALGQAERSAEANRMETFINKDSAVPEWIQQEIGKASAKTPGWDHNQVDYVDAWGRTQDYGKGNLFNQFLNPSYVSTDRSTAVDDELQRLYDAGQTAVFPQRRTQGEKITTRDAEGNNTGERYLTAEEYEQFNRTMGQHRLDLVEKTISGNAYKGMNDTQKAELISKLYEYSKAVATLEVEPNAVVDNWIKTAMESSNPAKSIQLYYSAQKLEPAEGYKEPALFQKVRYIANNTAEEEADEYIKPYLEGSRLTQYELAREYGYSPVRFAEAYEAYTTIKSDKGKKNKASKVIANLVAQGWPEEWAAPIYRLLSVDDKEKLANWKW